MAPKSGADGTGKNWLITSASNKVSLAEALQDAVSIYGSRLYSTDVSVLSAALYSTADFFVSLPADNIKYIDHLIENAMRLGVGVILPTRDEDLLVLSKNREVLLANGITVLCSSAKTIELCLDKVAFHSFCCAHGLPVFQNITDLALARFPVFLRGKDQYGKKFAERVDTFDEYAAKYGHKVPKGFLVQEYSDWDEYTTDILYDSAHIPVQWVSRRRIQIKSGESTISRVDTRAELSLLVEKISSAIDFVGHINVQTFCKVGEEPKIIEVNPRIGGSSELSIRAGLNSINRLVALIEGDLDFFYQNRSIEEGLTLLKFTNSFFLNSSDAQ